MGRPCTRPAPAPSCLPLHEVRRSMSSPSPPPIHRSAPLDTSRSGPERRPSVGQAHERIEKITVDGYRKACSDRDGKHVVGDTVHVGFMAVDLGADHDRYRETTAVSP